MKIEKQELLLQIKEVIKDEFIAEVEEETYMLFLSFSNGQKFQVILEEVI